MLKLSGEALAGEKGFGLDHEVVMGIARQIQEVVDLGLKLRWWSAGELWGCDRQ